MVGGKLLGDLRDMNPALRRISGKNALRMFMLTINLTATFSFLSALSQSERGVAAAANATLPQTVFEDLLCLESHKTRGLLPASLTCQTVILQQQPKHEALGLKARHRGDF